MGKGSELMERRRRGGGNKKCEVLWGRLQTWAELHGSEGRYEERVRSTIRDNCNYIAKLSYRSFIGPPFLCHLPPVLFDDSIHVFPLSSSVSVEIC